jgi:hypothetical protein
MKLKLQERGQSLVLIALAAVVLFGFSALAIDGSRVFSDRRNAQNAADTAALSAALAKIRGDSYADAALDRATSNGYANDSNSTVEVNLCSLLSGPNACQGIPTSDPEPAKIIPANYIQVKITSILPATFARIIGRNEFTNIVTAIAYAGPVEPQPLVKGNALAAMNPSDPDAIFGGGNMNLDVNNSGIFSNSTYQDALCNHGSMRTNGNGTYSVDTTIEVAGSFCPGNNTTINGPWAVTGPIDYPPTINIQIPNISCASGSSAPSYDESSFILTYHPGTYSDRIDPDSDAPPGKFVREAHFSPGNYCLGKGASFNGADVVANHVDFRISNGDFRINGSQFTCNDMLVHVNGGSGVDFSGTSNIYCNNVTFIMSSGGVTWNGAIENRMFAPTGGDYKGVLLYAPYPNSKAIKINGNSSNQLTGSIIAVAAPITVTGNDWTTGLNSQIIGNTVNLNGNGTLVINYVPDEQYLQVDPSAITLTK